MHMTVTLDDGATLACDIDGHGPDLVLVTGLGGTASFWNPLVARIAKHFRVIRFDQRGVARSTRGSAATSVARLAADTHTVVTATCTRRPLLLGHSLGGAILQEMERAHPGAYAGLILSATWGRRNRFMTALFEHRAALVEHAPHSYAAFVAFLGFPTDWLDQNWTVYEAMAAQAPITPAQVTVVRERIAALLAFDGVTGLEHSPTPMLVQGADDDLIVPAYLSRDLTHSLPAARLAMCTTGGHFFPISRPDHFCEQVVTFATEIGHITTKT
jgi:aminoacrylate hydrolase